MSSGRKLDANVVRPIAERVVERLIAADAVKRIEIAGSLRRRAAQVSDIEIVCEPRTASETDLFGAVVAERCCLADEIAEACRPGGWLRWRAETHPSPPKDWGEARRFWALVVLPQGVPCDLFAVRPPAQWGAIFAIRTGPHTFSQRLVTDCRSRGLRCVDGHLERIATGTPVATPEERDFLAACGSPWVEPENRR